MKSIYYIVIHLILASGIAPQAAGATQQKETAFQFRPIVSTGEEFADSMMLSHTNVDTGAVLRSEYKVGRTAIAGAKDVTSAQVVTNSDQSGFALELWLSDNARARLAAATGGIKPSSKGREFAVVVDGTLYRVIRAVGPITHGHLDIPGFHSGSSAEALKKKIIAARDGK